MRIFPLFLLVIAAAAPGLLRADSPGLAAKYPGDAGIEADPDVVFAENFENRTIDELEERWGHISNHEGKAMALTGDSLPEGSAGKTALRITATRGKDTGGHLFKVLKPGYDQLHIRYYVKFAADHGFTNHFVKLQGSVNPPKWPEGEAGYRHTKSFSSGLEPMGGSLHSWPPKGYPPPGIWHFYSYWPEMHSWETPEGVGESCYGNNFEPLEPAIAPRDQWQCVEFMIKLNSTPEAHDGEQAFWIDGKLAGKFAPGSVSGYWMRDNYRLAEPEKSTPFEGFRWRTDPAITINKVWLLYYVNYEEGTGKHVDKYAQENPDVPINTQSSTAWFDDVVVAKSYIGPIAGR